MAWNDFLNNFGKNKEKPKSNGSALSSPPKADGPNSLNIFGSQLAQPSKNPSSGDSSPKLPTEFLSQKPSPKPHQEQRKLNGLTQDDVIDPEQAFETARLENPSPHPAAEFKPSSNEPTGMNGSSESFSGFTNLPDPMANFQSHENFTDSPLSAEPANEFLSTNNSPENTFDSPPQNLTGALGSPDLFASLSPSASSLTPDPFSQLSALSGKSETSDLFASLTPGGELGSESPDLFASLNNINSSQIEPPMMEAATTDSQDLFQYPMGNEDLLNFTSSTQEMNDLNTQELPEEAPEILDSANDLLAFLNTNGSISQNSSTSFTSSEAAALETESSLPEMVDDAFLMDQANDLLSSFTSGNNHFGGTTAFTPDDHAETTDNEKESLNFMNSNDTLSLQSPLSASSSPNPLEDLLAQFSNKPGVNDATALESPLTITDAMPGSINGPMQDLMPASEQTKPSSTNGLEDLLAQFSSTQIAPGEATDSTNMLQAPFTQEPSIPDLEASKPINPLPINPLNDLLAQFKPSESKEDASTSFQASPLKMDSESEAIKDPLNLNPMAHNFEMSFIQCGQDPIQDTAPPIKSTEATKPHNPMEDLLSKLNQAGSAADPILPPSVESQDLLKNKSEDFILEGGLQADPMNDLFAQPLSSFSINDLGNDPGFLENVPSENLNNLIDSDLTDVELLNQTAFNESMGFESLASTLEAPPKSENPTPEKTFELSCPEFGVTPSLAELLASNDLIDNNFHESLASNPIQKSTKLEDPSMLEADNTTSVSDFLKMSDPILSTNLNPEEIFSPDPTALQTLQHETEPTQMPAEIAFSETTLQDEVPNEMFLAESLPSEPMNHYSVAEPTFEEKANHSQESNATTESTINPTNQNQELPTPSQEPSALPKQSNAKKRFPGSSFQFSAQRDLYRQEHLRGNQNFGAFPEGYHPLEESLKELKTTSLKHEAQFTKMSIDHLVSQYFSNKEADLNTES